MNAPIGTLQVVPDIDNQPEEKTTQPTKQQLQTNTAKILSSLEVKVAPTPNPPPQLESTPVLMMSSRIPNMVRRRGQPELNTPIQQMSSDAQPLSNAEILAHRQLLRVQRQDVVFSNRQLPSSNRS